jgi:hypothetical protein
VYEHLDTGRTETELAQQIADEWRKTVGRGDVIYRQPSLDSILI